MLAFVAAAQAATEVELRDRKQHIAQQRREVAAQFAERERRCHEQFVVTSCVEDVRAERRRALEKLAQEQAVVDEALRQQRAADRLQQLADKQRAASARQSASAPPPRVVQRLAPALRAASAPSPAASSAERPGPRPAQALGAGERRARQAAYEQRIREAEQRRLDVERRQQERARQGRTQAAPLPTPAASDLPR